MCNALEIPQMWGPTQSKVLLYISLTASVCIMTFPLHLKLRFLGTDLSHSAQGQASSPDLGNSFFQVIYHLHLSLP